MNLLENSQPGIGSLLSKLNPCDSINPMGIKRHIGLIGSSSARTRQGRASVSRPKKSAAKKVYKAAPTRTRTSLIGMTIYQPDLTPSPVGQKLLEALER